MTTGSACVIYREYLYISDAGADISIDSHTANRGMQHIRTVVLFLERENAMQNNMPHICTLGVSMRDSLRNAVIVASNAFWMLSGSS